MSQYNECWDETIDRSDAYGQILRSEFGEFAANEAKKTAMVIAGYVFRDAAAIVLEYRDIDVSHIARYAAHVSVILSDKCDADCYSEYGHDGEKCHDAADWAAQKLLYDYGQCEERCSVQCSWFRRCGETLEYAAMMRGDVEHIALIAAHWKESVHSGTIAVAAFAVWVENGWFELCDLLFSSMRNLPRHMWRKIINIIIGAESATQARLASAVRRCGYGLMEPIPRRPSAVMFLIAFIAIARPLVISDIHCAVRLGFRRGEVVNALIIAESALPGDWPVTQCVHCGTNVSAAGGYRGVR